MTLAHVVAPEAAWGAWAPDPIEITILAAVAVLYARGARRLRADGPTRALRRRQVAAFSAGLTVVAAALLSPLDPLADTLFSWHMTQHVALVLLAAPLLVYGRPLLAVGLGLPSGVRRAGLRFVSTGAVAPVLDTGRHPVVVWGLYAVAFWGWHLPGPYQAAVHDGGLHALEHLSFLGVALLFWSVVLGTGPRRRLSYGPTLAFVFTTMVHSVWLAMILSFVPTAVYPVYAPGAGSWGLTAAADQSIAGVVMWVPSAVVLSVTLGVLFLRWFRELDARMRPPSGPAQEPSTTGVGEHR